MSPKRILLIPALAGAAALAFVACGGIPSDGVATVGDAVITRAEFTKWLGIAQQQQAQQAGGGSQAKLVPPAFKACVAQARKRDKRTAEAALRQSCKQQYNQLKTQVMQFLINADWIQGEASDRGIEVSDEQVDKEYKKTKKQFFPSEKDFKKFLKDSGQSVEDVRFRVKLQLLSDKIRKEVTKSDDKISDSAVERYYEQNKEQFSQPETRDFRVVVTKTRAKADQAKQRLEGGESFKAVAKDLSIDEATKSSGGLLAGQAEGQVGSEFDKVAFEAKKGKIEGPVKTSLGYYVFEVVKITPGSEQSLKQATPLIRQQIKAQRQQKALDKFVKDFQKKWKDKTDCRKGYVVPDCKNAPKPKTGTGGAPAVPGQGGGGTGGSGGGSSGQ